MLHLGPKIPRTGFRAGFMVSIKPEINEEVELAWISLESSMGRRVGKILYFVIPFSWCYRICPTRVILLYGKTYKMVGG